MSNKKVTISFNYNDYSSLSNSDFAGAMSMMEDAVFEAIPDAIVEVIKKGCSFGDGIIEVECPENTNVEDLLESISEYENRDNGWQIGDSYQFEVIEAENRFIPSKPELQEALGQRIMDYRVNPNGDVFFSLKPYEYGWPSDRDFYADFCLDKSGTLMWLPDIPTETLVANGRITTIDELSKAIMDDFGNWEPDIEDEDSNNEYCDNCGEVLDDDNCVEDSTYCQACTNEIEEEDADE